MTERNVCDFRADPSGRQVSTAAIQRAIAETDHNDTLVIPAGRFLTGSLFPKWNDPAPGSGRAASW
jgi:polygalacturonase